MAKLDSFTDEELKEALIRCNGQPTKAAEMLGVTYIAVYFRVRRNPELLEVQKAYRARSFQAVSNLTLNTFLTGVMQEPEIDENGNIVEGKFKKIIVDHRTRLSLAPNLMQTFKSDEGIKEQIEIENKGSVDISNWLKANNQNDTDTKGL